MLVINFHFVKHILQFERFAICEGDHHAFDETIDKL